jgi:tetratricopeptide (TPR) repeat protein
LIPIIVPLIIAGADKMNKILDRVLDTLKGADYWIAAAFLVAGLISWLWLGKTKRREKKVLNRQIGVSLVLALVAGGAIWANHSFFQREPVFSKDLTGIVVMRIVGDDALDSLRGDLVEKLNAELQKEFARQPIEVHASREMVDENKGLAAAHKRARAIGQRLNAKLVIWGRKIGEKKFYPRITVISAPEHWSGARERTHDVQNITELQLPEELVDEPFYLIHFAAGYSYYAQENYKDALPHLEAALRRKGGLPNELADLQFFTGFCAYSVGGGQKDITAKLQEAIMLYENAAKVYESSEQKKWALIQLNLGAAYRTLPTGDRAVNVQKAIDAYEGALRVYTEKDFPIDWAMTQNNLGNAYSTSPTGDRTANLQKAIAAYEAALRVRTEKDFPTDWAMTQSNLGVAYADLPTGDRAANVQKAIAAHEAALRVRTEKDFPTDWAMSQNNLANAYLALPTGDRAANAQKAIAAYEATTLRVFTEKDFPIDWAMTQNNLGNAYTMLPTGDRTANMQKAIAAYEAALRVRTKKDFPIAWAMTQNNLGIAYAELPTGDHMENLKSAKVCFEAALTVYTESGFPENHRNTSASLAQVMQELRGLSSE